MKYTDKAGVKHDLQVTWENHKAGAIYTIQRDGDFFCELIRDEGRWTELYGGFTSKSEEYGRVLEKVFIPAH